MTGTSSASTPSLALLTFSGWYWTRALIAARFDVPHSADGLEALQQADDRIDPYAYDAVPWIVFFLTFLLGLGLIVRSAPDLVLAGLPLLIWLALFILYRPGRRIGAARAPRRVAFGTAQPYRSVNQGQPKRSTGNLARLVARPARPLPPAGQSRARRTRGGRDVHRPSRCSCSSGARSPRSSPSPTPSSACRSPSPRSSTGRAPRCSSPR